MPARAAEAALAQSHVPSRVNSHTGPPIVNRQSSIVNAPSAYRIQTPRLVLRCWNPSDAPMLAAAIAVSLDHLRPWVPWAANEPEELAARIKRMQRWRARFDLGLDFFYGIFDVNENQVLGGAGSHARIGAGAREIGYWIRADQVRQGLATEAAACLTKVGFALQALRRMEIHCDPRNIASAAVPRKLGYSNQVNIARCVPNETTGPRDLAIWSMTPAAHENSPSAKAHIEVFDAVGSQVL